MSAAATFVTLVARTLPATIRARYREEWLADLHGAAELGLGPRSIIGGAVATAATIDRGDPFASGMPRSALAVRRARWAAGLLASAIVLGLGLFFWGGFEGAVRQGMVGGEGLVIAGSVLQVGALLLVAGGAATALSAVMHGTAAFGPRRVILAILPIPVTVIVLALATIMPFMGILGGFTGLVGAAVLLVVFASDPMDGDAPAQESRARRVRLALPWSLLTLIAVATGLLHITVWNPLARVPGLTLDEIYAEMAAYDQATGTPMIVGWAVTWSLAAIALPLLCMVPRLARALTARRILVIGLLTLGATVFFEFFAGFLMGMSMADTFMTSGGDAALTGPVLGVVGTLALLAAILIGFAPARRPVPTTA